MADMDTYDNEPRTYDGMHDAYSYGPYAHRRRLRSYHDLVSYHSSSDPWSRTSEGEFNINPHYGQRWHATPTCNHTY